jgi:hypothetical protein
MRKLALVIALVALAAFAVGPASAAKSGIGVQYCWKGQTGVLTVANAANQLMTVWSGDYSVKTTEWVPTNFYSAPQANKGPAADGSILHIAVDDVVFDVFDEDWYWD